MKGDHLQQTAVEDGHQRDQGHRDGAHLGKERVGHVKHEGVDHELYDVYVPTTAAVIKALIKRSSRCSRGHQEVIRDSTCRSGRVSSRHGRPVIRSNQKQSAAIRSNLELTPWASCRPCPCGAGGTSRVAGSRGHRRFARSRRRRSCSCLPSRGGPCNQKPSP